MFIKPVYADSPRRAARPMPPPAPIVRDSAASAWRRVEHALVYLADPRVCPVTLPLRPEQGLARLKSGRPAQRFIADGFIVGGKAVSCLVAPDDRTGCPVVLWADGAPINRFHVMGG